MTSLLKSIPGTGTNFLSYLVLSAGHKKLSVPKVPPFCCHDANHTCSGTTHPHPDTILPHISIWGAFLSKFVQLGVHFFFRKNTIVPAHLNFPPSGCISFIGDTSLVLFASPSLAGSHGVWTILTTPRTFLLWQNTSIYPTVRFLFLIFFGGTPVSKKTLAIFSWYEWPWFVCDLDVMGVTSIK